GRHFAPGVGRDTAAVSGLHTVQQLAHDRRLLLLDRRLRRSADAVLLLLHPVQVPPVLPVQQRGLAGSDVTATLYAAGRLLPAVSLGSPCRRSSNEAPPTATAARAAKRPASATPNGINAKRAGPTPRLWANAAASPAVPSRSAKKHAPKKARPFV